MKKYLIYAIGILLLLNGVQYWLMKRKLQARTINYEKIIGNYKIKTAEYKRKIKSKDEKINDLLKAEDITPEEKITITVPEKTEKGDEKEGVVYFDSGKIDLDTMELTLDEREIEILLGDGMAVTKKDLDIEYQTAQKPRKKYRVYVGINYDMELLIGGTMDFGIFSGLGVVSKDFAGIAIGIQF